METLTIEKLWLQIIHELHVMPCCGLPIRFYKGPRGGLAQNICCAHCGAEWNVTPGFIERIGVKEDGFQPCPQTP